MAQKSVRITLSIDDNFSSGLDRAAAAAKSFGNTLAAMDATWEPIDWSEF